MLIKKERIAVKKRKEDFMLLTASAAGMDLRVLAAHNFYRDMILNEINAKMAVAASPSTPALASASASTPATTSMSSAAMASASLIDRAEVVVLDGPTPTQEAPSASPNPFF
jgi:hypothetical protein